MCKRHGDQVPMPHVSVPRNAAEEKKLVPPDEGIEEGQEEQKGLRVTHTNCRTAPRTNTPGGMPILFASAADVRQVLGIAADRLGNQVPAFIIFFLWHSIVGSSLDVIDLKRELQNAVVSYSGESAAVETIVSGESRNQTFGLAESANHVGLAAGEHERAAHNAH